MSAYIVHLDTIDYLTEAARRWRVEAYAQLPTTAPALEIARSVLTDYRVAHTLHAVTDYEVVAAVLYAANADSVNYRYESLDSTDIPTHPHAPIREVDPVDVLKSVGCLRYQSCERPGYDQTFAAELLRAIELTAIRKLERYDDAPWGWVRPRRVA